MQTIQTTPAEHLLQQLLQAGKIKINDSFSVVKNESSTLLTIEKVFSTSAARPGSDRFTQTEDNMDYSKTPGRT